MKNIKTNLFTMAALKIVAIVTGCLGLYYILCSYNHVAFTLANVELWVGCIAIAVITVLVNHLFKEIRKQDLAAAAA